MPDMAADIQGLSKKLDEAQQKAKAIPQITGITVDEGYAIQLDAFNRRIARGEHKTGMKMGFTSRAKMIQMGVDDMIWGRLSSGMLVEDGGSISMKDYVHPRVEPEIAFLLGERIDGPVTTAQAMAAIEAVAPAIEIIDSRYANFKFSWADVVADNCSAAGYVIGAWQTLDADLSNLGMILEFNGRPVQIGSSAAILGHPVRSLAAAARLCAESGEALEPGWIVMAGGATAAEALKPDTYVRLTVEDLGTVAFSVTK
jgi:2-oxo-3-hexenedioate decarboxylase